MKIGANVIKMYDMDRVKKLGEGRRRPILKVISGNQVRIPLLKDAKVCLRWNLSTENVAVVSGKGREMSTGTRESSTDISST